MAILFLITIILLGILFAISLYLYDNSDFSKMTGFSYFKLWSDKKVRFTYKIMNALHKANGDHHILMNVKIPVNGSYRIIDAILVHESGIYVIDLKQCGGWIYGREQDAEWAQALHKDQLNTFDNPIVSNKKIIFVLKEILGDIDREWFNSLIVFSDGCSFKKIEIHSKNVDIIKTNELNHYWSKNMDEKLSKDQIKKLYLSLEKYMDFPAKGKNKSIENVTVN